MALDITELKGLVDQLEAETNEAVAAKSDLDIKSSQAAAAMSARETALDEYTRQNDERLAKMQEIIAKLQAAVAEE